MKIARFYFLIWVVILAVGIAASFMTRLSYAEFKIEDIDYSKIIVRLGISKTNEFDNEFMKYNSFDDLYMKSDLVVKVIFEGIRKTHSESIFSTVKVLDVYKGDDDKSGSNIFVYEESFFGYEENYSKSFFTSGCYNLMKKNTEYILFLNNREFNDKYMPSEIEKNTYLVNNYAFGKYNISNDNPITLLDADKKYTYDQVASEEVITTSQEILDRYGQWEKNVLEMVNASNNDK